MSIHAERLTAQLLTGPPARDAAAVCERLLAVQAQDPRGFRLAIRARTEGLRASDVDRALDDREVVVTWLNRGTLHLVRAEDYPWLHAVTTPQLETGVLRRLGQEGIADPEEVVAKVERALAADGPLTRDQLAEHLGHTGPGMPQILFLASLRKGVVRGPMRGRQHAYVLARDWLGEQPEVDRDTALEELARRYLAGHAPATDRDLAKWAGITLRDARAGLAAAGEPPRIEPHKLPPPKLLGAFEPVLLGWTERDDVAGPHRDQILKGGLFSPFALAEGRAVATWGLSGGKVTIDPLERLDAKTSDALHEDADAVRHFLQG